MEAQVKLVKIATFVCMERQKLKGKCIFITTLLKKSGKE